MKTSKNNLSKQLFICCNTKPDGSGCAPKGSEGLRNRLKERVQALKNPALKVTKCGCLGTCTEGISGMLYPEGNLLTQINLEDEDELFRMMTE